MMTSISVYFFCSFNRHVLASQNLNSAVICREDQNGDGKEAGMF